MSKVYVVHRVRECGYDLLGSRGYAFKNKRDAEDFCQKNSLGLETWHGLYVVSNKNGITDTMEIYELEMYDSDDVEFEKEW